jgi:predicted Zn-dependent protease
MRTLNKKQIGYEAYYLFYILPYKRESKMMASEDHEELEEKEEKDLLEKTKNYLYKSSELLNRVSVRINDQNCNIILSAEYEGYSGYYDYELDFELVNYINENGERELMLLGYIAQSEHELFEEIIKEKILPKWSKYLGLKSYYEI